MNKILAVVAALAMLPALPAAAATTQIANSSSSAFCSEAAAEGYKRPGGYCDQIDDTNSLLPTGSPPPCPHYADAGIRFGEDGAILVAGFDPCCDVGTLFDGILPPEDFLVADACN